MKYKPLYQIYYNDKKAYQEAYEKRINSAEVVKLGLEISGTEAFYLPCQEVHALVSEILRIDKQAYILKNQLPTKALEQFRMDCLIDEIVITNSIEGIHSTRREIQDVIDSLGTSKCQEKRFEGLVNQYILLGEGQVNLETCEDVRALYDELVLGEVLANDYDNSPDGKIFRRDSVDIRSGAQKIIHTGVYPEEKIIEYMQKSLDILNDGEVDILVRTAIFHYLFGYIHPFYDGNGRLSRFISSYYLTEDLDSLIGNRLSYTIQDNMSDYYKAFKVCNDPINRGDVTSFVVMFLGIVKKAEENLLYALAKRHDLYEKYSGVMFAVSTRDKWDQSTEKLCHVLLIGTLFASDGMSKQELLDELGIKSKTTLNAKLNTLRKYELIEEIKDGRAARYRLDCGRLNVDVG